MRSLAARLRQDALGGLHPAHVFRAGFLADQNDVFTLFGQSLGLARREDHLATGRPGYGVDTFSDAPPPQFLARHALADDGIEQAFNVVARNAGDRVVLADYRARGALLVLARQIAGLRQAPRFFPPHQGLRGLLNGDAESGVRGALAGAALQDVQLAALEREFDVLHLAVVHLEHGPHGAKLVVHGGHALGQFTHVQRRPDAGHHVLALGVDQHVAVKLVGPGARIAREAHAGAAVLAHVAEDHLLHVDAGARQVGDLLHAPIRDGLLGVPRIKDGVDRTDELLPRVLRELAPGLLAKEVLELPAQLLQRFGRKLIVVALAEAFLQVVQLLFQNILAQPDGRGRVHLQEAAVRIPGEARVLRVAGQTLDGLVVHAEVEDRFHHARHGTGGAAADRNQQRVVLVTQLLADCLLQPCELLTNFLFQALRPGAVVLVKIGARIDRNRKARRNRQTDVGHLRQPGAFAAEQVLVGTLALRLTGAEKVHKLLHVTRSLQNRRNAILTKPSRKLNGVPSVPRRRQSHNYKAIPDRGHHA